MTKLDDLLLLEKNGELKGFYHITDDVYFDPRCPGINRSSLELISQNPSQFKSGIKSYDKKSLAFGKALHARLLEPTKFFSEFVICPKFDLRTTIGKKDKELFELNSLGKTIIDEGDFETIELMSSHFQSHEQLKSYLQNSVNEQAMFWQDASTGILCRAKIDMLVQNENILIDLKTSKDSSPQGFGMAVADYHLYAQAAFYSDGFLTVTGIYPRFLFAVLDKNMPHQVQTYELPFNLVDYGRKRYQYQLDKFKYLSENDKWFEPNEIVIPYFLTKRMEGVE